MPPRNTIDDLWAYIEMRLPTECWPWLGSWGGRERHQLPYFYIGGDRVVAYRSVYEQVNGVALDPKVMILHSCDNGKYPVGCCNPRHMRPGNHKENGADMMERERHGLSHYVVRNIRRLREEGRTQQEIADLYGISRATISAIDTKRQYNHVKDEEDGSTGAAKGNGLDGE